MNLVTLDTYPRPRPEVVGQLLDTEAVVVVPAQGQVKVLNEVAARIWALADGTRSVREIAACLTTEFTVSTTQAEQDALYFVGQLVQRGMVQL